MVAAFEQRSARRTDVSWPVSIWNPKATRFYNGRSVNVSSGGALVALPMNAPVVEGQALEVNFPRSESLAKQKGAFARVKSARVVRIDRSDVMNTARIKVGLEFESRSTVPAEPLLATL